jgi:hypothetical protein
MEVFKGNQICLSRVLSEISDSRLLTSDSVSTFHHPPWDRNTMWFGG